MDIVSKIEEQVEDAKSMSKFFELDLSIKMFGRVIFHFHYPPEKS